MQLFLMRHGDYVSETVDPKHPLSDKGRNDVSKIGAFFKKNDIEFDAIIHSTKIRAKQTALIIKGIINPEAEISEKEYLCPHDSVDNIYSDILNFKGNLMIVGHLPFLPKLVSRLLSSGEKKVMLSMQTGSAVGLFKEQDKWSMDFYISPESVE